MTAPSYIAHLDGTRVVIVAVSSGVGHPTREGALRKLLSATAQKIDALIEQRRRLREALAAECAAVAL